MALMAPISVGTDLGFRKRSVRQIWREDQSSSRRIFNEVSAYAWGKVLVNFTIRLSLNWDFEPCTDPERLFEARLNPELILTICAISLGTGPVKSLSSNEKAVTDVNSPNWRDGGGTEGS